MALFSPREGYQSGTYPRLAQFGLEWFVKYTVMLVLIHHFTLFYLEVFTLESFFQHLVQGFFKFSVNLTDYNFQSVFCFSKITDGSVCFTQKYYSRHFYYWLHWHWLSGLFYIQVIDSSYKLSAENNSQRIEILYPARGLIYDRNGKLLVYNQPSYDLMIAPYELRPLTVLEFCSILDIDMKRLRAGIARAWIPDTAENLLSNKFHLKPMQFCRKNCTNSPDFMFVHAPCANTAKNLHLICLDMWVRWMKN